MNLNPKLQKLIDERVKSGKYASPEDVLAAALCTLDQQEWFANFAAGELDVLLAEGELSIERDGILDGDEAFGRDKCDDGIEGLHEVLPANWTSSKLHHF